MDKDYEVIKAELWEKIYLAYVRAGRSCRAPIRAIEWADKTVQCFDNRFKKN